MSQQQLMHARGGCTSPAHAVLSHRDLSPHPGLPEEVAHTKQCLARGYAVLALRSLDREYRSRCFSSSGTKLSEWLPPGEVEHACGSSAQSLLRPGSPELHPL